MRNHERGRGAASTQRKPMIFGKRTLAAETRHDGYIGEFGEVDQLRGRLGVQDLLSRNDHRPVCLEKPANYRFHVIVSCH